MLKTWVMCRFFSCLPPPHISLSFVCFLLLVLDVRKGLSLGGHHHLPYLLLKKKVKILIFKGTSVIATNALKLLGLTNLVTRRPLPMLITFFIYYFQWEKCSMVEVFRNLFIQYRSCTSCERGWPYRNIIILLKNTYPLKAISVLMLAFPYYSLWFKNPCTHLLCWLLAYC